MSYKMSDSQPFRTLRNLCCGACNSQFFFKDFTLKGSRCPMLLHCGHSICEGCIQKNLKLAKIIACPLCGSASSLNSSQQTSECFPLNMYLVGSLVALQNSRQGKDKGLKAFLIEKCGNFDYAVKEQADLNSKPDPSDSACEECSLAALWYCENCKSNLCEICWTRVHGSARTLMRHCKIAISNVETARISLRKCVEHEAQDLEFFCKGCSTLVCSHCAILRHQGEGHCPITLKEKNLEMIGNMKIAAEEAEKISKRMRHTLEKIKITQSSFKTPDGLYSELETQIRRNFSRIHGILQLEEDRVLKQLHENSRQRGNLIRALRLQLETQIENVKGLLSQYEFAVGKPDRCDLTDLHRRLKEVENLPCYLISKNPCDKEPKVEFDERLIELLQVYCTMDLPSSEIFELRSGSNLPEGSAVEPLDASDVEQNVDSFPRPGRKSGASDVDSLSSCSSPNLTKGDPESLLPKTSKESKVFLERKNYSVRVSYIKNPGEFYVTLNSQRSKQQAIDKRSSDFGDRSSDIPTTVAKDKVYLVKYNVDKKWYRARVTEVFPPKKTGDEELVFVYYLDYGNSETVPISRLRSIPADMLDPPLAVRCKLFDCVPKDGEWCVESTKTMEKILNNYTATMFVMGVHPHYLEVDLSVIYPDGQIGRDIVSVRDALLFLEFSSFVHGSKIPCGATALKYLEQCLPAVGETFDVIVTHVNSPSDFFVQRVKQDTSYLYKLIIDLQNYYSENSEKGIIYNPSIGMPCAALFSTDQKWYRAEILNIPGKKMVTVFYVDYGNIETIPWTGIRKLKECFVKWPALALNCSLADILPVGNLWSAQAIGHMEKYIMMRDCRVQVHGRLQSRPTLKVFLYNQVNKTEVCVNKVFVDKGYAIKTELNSLPKTKNEEEAMLEGSLLKANKCCQGKSNGEDQITSSRRKTCLKKSRAFKDRNKLSAKKLQELHESEKKKCDEDSFNEDTGNEVDEFDNIFKVKVEVLWAESPSSIYVTPPVLMEEFKHLQLKLNEFYKDSPYVAAEWTVGSVCAVFDSTKACWYRASVLSILPNNHAKVFLMDVARVSSEPISALRNLDSSFLQYATCTVKCHLADVRPPGEQWPSVSSEYLWEEIQRFKEVYMTKRGQIDNKSLPVELWVQKIVLRGALEPSTKKWVTLNRLLVDQGLAVPVKGNMRSSCTPSSGEECSAVVDDSGDKQIARVECPFDAENVEVVEVANVSDAYTPSLGCRWLPPEPLKRSRFIGIPTFVDFNAYIHMYDSEQDEKTLNMIRDTLFKEYGNSKPNLDHIWSPGQLCIARYHADDSWYRGVIIHVNEDVTYEVLFVDYGNVETCELSDLRKGPKTQEIPIVSHNYQLQGISPASEDGKWPIAIIDVLHSLVVDKKCEVNVLKFSLDPGGPHVISLKLIEEDVEVKNFLVDRGLALFTFSAIDGFDRSDITSDDSDLNGDSSLVSPKRGQRADVPSHYIPLNIPDICTGFFIRVTAVESETEFFANIADDESITSTLKRILNEFESLEKELTNECQLQPHLKKLTKGQPCCCVRLRSLKWCRGEVESFIKKDDLVSVSFIDYGGKEFVHKDLLRECKSEWLRLPKMAVKLRLANIERCPNVSESVYMMALTHCLDQNLLFAEILSAEGEVPEVRLLTDRNGLLAYQEMIDKKLMTFIV